MPGVILLVTARVSITLFQLVSLETTTLGWFKLFCFCHKTAGMLAIFKYKIANLLIKYIFFL